MRIVFFGNAPNYSDRFAEALIRRSNNAKDPATLVAIVCPQRQSSKRLAKRFALLVRTARAVERLFGHGVQQRIFGQRGAVYFAMQHHAAEGRVPVFFPASLEPTLDAVTALRPDLCIVAGLNRIFKSHMIDRLPPIYNIHPSPLPAYRGGTPEFWQLADGAEQGGVTLHRIDPGIDTGPIVLQRQFAIPPWVDIRELGELNVREGLALLDAFLDGYPETGQRSLSQTGVGFHRPFPEPSDRIAPFAGGARAVFNRARAYGWTEPLIVDVDPVEWQQGAAVAVPEQAGQTRSIRLFEPVPFTENSGDPPGTLRATSAGGATLSCNPGTVWFRRAQLV